MKATKSFLAGSSRNLIWILGSGSHRMVLVGRDPKACLVPTLCRGQGHLPLVQAAHGPIHPGLEHLQEWDICSFSGQPVRVL